MSATRELELEMFRRGYVSAPVAARLAMVSAFGPIQKALREKRLRGVRHGRRYWFVEIKSLLEAYGGNVVVAERIRNYRPTA